MTRQIDDSSILEKVFDGKYQNVRLAEEGEGTQSTGYIGDMGGSRRVFIKKSKGFSGSNAEFVSSRGCSMANDLKVQSGIPIDGALTNNISPLIDFAKIDGEYVTVEPLFENAKSLKRWGIITSKRDFEDLMTGVIDAEYALINDYRYFHRDLHPGNIILRRNSEGRLETRLTDLKNAKKVTDVRAQSVPTAGGRFSRDPLLDECFTGDIGKYTESSEIYQIGMNAIVALIGQPPVQYDFLQRTAVNTFTGRPILDGNGRVDRIKHQAAIDHAIKRIPRKIRKAHGDWIRNCLTLHPANRTQGIETLMANFKDAKHPGFLESLRRHVGVIAATGIVTLFGAGTSLLPVIQHYQTQQQVQIAEASRYRVVTEFDGYTLEHSNNFVELNTTFSFNQSAYPHYTKIINVGSGDRISTTVTARKLPYPQGSFNGAIGLEGRIYIEGYPFEDGDIGKDFHVYLYEHDTTKNAEDRGFFGYFGEFTVPLELKPGVYALTTELFAPDESALERNEPLRELDFVEPGGVLSRKRVPLIVGGLREAVDIGSLRFSWDGDHVSFRDLNANVSLGYQIAKTEGLEILQEVPEERIYRQITGWFGGLMLPYGAGDTSPRNLYLAIYDGCGDRIYFTGFPIKRNYRGPENEPKRDFFYDWSIGSPGRDFAEKLYNYRVELDQRDMVNR